MIDSFFKSKRSIKYFGAAVACFALYTVVTSFNALSPLQWGISFLLTAGAAAIYFGLGSPLLKDSPARGSLTVISFYIVAALLVFHPTMHNIFRSDYWHIALLFDTVSDFNLEAAKRLSLFEIFGDMRFQPAAHLLMYFRHIIFGDEVVLFHLLNIILHSVTGFALYAALNRFIKDRAYSFIFGLLFIVLQSHFDTVVWTYHIYIILSSILILTAVNLTKRYIDGEKAVSVYIAGLLSIFSILLYEPSIAIPFLLFLMAGAAFLTEEGVVERRTVFIAGFSAAAVYIVYAGVTLFGLSLTEGEHKVVSGGDLITFDNILMGLVALFKSLWHTIYLENIGITAELNIVEIIYIHPPEGVFTSFTALVIMGLSVALFSLMRAGKEHRYFVLLLILIGISYLSVIALGRVHSNSIRYFTSQSRYFYFSNAAFLLAAGLLLYRKYGEQSTKWIILIILTAGFFWNTSNTQMANSEVGRNMSFLDDPHYELKAFTDSNPSAKIFIDYIPFNEGRLFLGTDIALDIMHEGNITKYKRLATHIYDERGLRRNPDYMAGASPSPALGDFTVKWTFRFFKQAESWKDIVVIGSDESYPRITTTLDGVIKLALLSAATGAVEEFDFHPAYRMKGYNDWYEATLVKDGDVICLKYFDMVHDSVVLTSEYENWRSDGTELLGPHYYGKGASSYIADLFMMLDEAGDGCGKLK